MPFLVTFEAVVPPINVELTNRSVVELKFDKLNVAESENVKFCIQGTHFYQKGVGVNQPI